MRAGQMTGTRPKQFERARSSSKSGINNACSWIFTSVHIKPSNKEEVIQEGNLTPALVSLASSSLVSSSLVAPALVPSSLVVSALVSLVILALVSSSLVAPALVVLPALNGGPALYPQFA